MGHERAITQVLMGYKPNRLFLLFSSPVLLQLEKMKNLAHKGGQVCGRVPRTGGLKPQPNTSTSYTLHPTGVKTL